jgi:hypothetical protein
MARNPFRRRREPLQSRTAAVSSAGSMASTMLQSLQQPWQARARLFAKRLGLVSFELDVTTSVGSRCRFVIQQDVGGDTWQEVKGLSYVLDWYHNDQQSFVELVAAHIYRVGVDGDRYEILDDTRDGRASYWVLPTDKVQWQGNCAREMLAPNGKEQDGTALQLDADRLVRMWTPDMDYPLLGDSPMSSVIDDCERYWSLMKYVRKTADSRLAMNKILWTPLGAHKPLPAEMQQGGTVPRSELDVAIAQAAKTSFERDDSLQGIMPFILRWEKELGEPKLLDLARGLEPEVLAHMQNAAEMIAGGLPLPQQLLLGEGSNHWTDWLLDEQSFRWGVAPSVERVCNDLTISFLLPTLRALAPGDPAITDPASFRIWYDPAPVLIHPDRTANALPLNLAGLLAAVPTLEAYGFSGADLMQEAERAVYKEFRVATRQTLNPTDVPVGEGPLPIGPGGTSQKPPAVPAALSAREVRRELTSALAPFEAELLAFYRG